MRYVVTVFAKHGDFTQDWGEWTITAGYAHEASDKGVALALANRYMDADIDSLRTVVARSPKDGEYWGGDASAYTYEPEPTPKWRRVS